MTTNKVSTVFQVNGKEADVKGVVPLKIGDWKKLKKEHGLTKERLEKGDLDDISTLLLYTLSKANPSITMADVDELSLTDKRLLQLIHMLSGKEVPPELLDHPT